MLYKIKLISLLQVVLGIILYVAAFWSWNKPFDHDELEAVHTAWKILQGERIYVDFFQHHHPLLYFLLVPLLAVFKENVTVLIAIRVVIFCFFSLILFVTYQISVKVFDQTSSYISLILLSTTFIFTTNVIEIRPDVPQTLFGLISILFLLVYFEYKSLKYLVFSSLALVISFLFLQKAIFLVLLVSLILLYKVYKNEIRYHSTCVYLLVFLLVYLPYISYLIYSNSLSNYVMFNWTLNVNFLSRDSPINTLILTYKTNTLIWFYYVLGIIFFTKNFSQKLVNFLSLGLLISIFLLQKAHQQYFMQAIPLVAIMSGYSLNVLHATSKKMLLVVLLLAIALPCYSLFGGTVGMSNSSQLQKISYVLSITKPDDYVYDGNALFNIFRKDLDFFWFSVDQGDALTTYSRMTGYQYNIYELVEQFKPKVISNYFIPNMSDPRIAEHYKQSSRYKDLFIRTESS